MLVRLLALVPHNTTPGRAGVLIVPDRCEGCAKVGDDRQPMPWCPRCLATTYCSAECQRAHWRREHVHECRHFDAVVLQPDAPKTTLCTAFFAQLWSTLRHLVPFQCTQCGCTRDVVPVPCTSGIPVSPDDFLAWKCIEAEMKRPPCAYTLLCGACLLANLAAPHDRPTVPILTLFAPDPCRERELVVLHVLPSQWIVVLSTRRVRAFECPTLPCQALDLCNEITSH